MKHLLLIAILIGCQSQADKDRAKMNKLIRIRDSFKTVLLDKTNTYIDQQIDVWTAYNRAIGDKDSINSLIKINKEVSGKYFVDTVHLQRSIRDVNKEIEDLKLLMGK